MDAAPTVRPLTYHDAASRTGTAGPAGGPDASSNAPRWSADRACGPCREYDGPRVEWRTGRIGRPYHCGYGDLMRADETLGREVIHPRDGAVVRITRMDGTEDGMVRLQAARPAPGRARSGYALDSVPLPADEEVRERWLVARRAAARAGSRGTRQEAAVPGVHRWLIPMRAVDAVIA